MDICKGEEERWLIPLCTGLIPRLDKDEDHKTYLWPRRTANVGKDTEGRKTQLWSKWSREHGMS